MSTRYARHVAPQHTPQTEALPGQVANSAGGFSFAVDDWTRLDRFLILGSEGGSYYATERKLTKENAAAVERCLAVDGLRVVAKIVEVSKAGRAPKNDPALFALALACRLGDKATKAAAYAALPEVARIGTHLFHWADAMKTLGGLSGSGAKRAVGRWYAQAAKKIALQVIKYQQRDGWSHRDLLRLAHPSSPTPTHSALYDWAVRGWPEVGEKPHQDEVLRLVWAFERAKTARGKELVSLIREYGLPHECVPNDAKNDPTVWEAILEADMGLGALVRNLGKLTSVGVIGPLSAHARLVAERLGDVEAIRKARLHPLSILVALRTYAQGHGDKGSLRWDPVQMVVDALDSAFYSAFKAVEPTGKRYLLALDVSGSMSGQLAGMPISCAEGTAAMSLVTANVEPAYHIMAFCHQFVPLKISPRMRLDQAAAETQKVNFGTTDCSVPIMWALANKIPVDVFQVMTDSETYAGNIHPTVALREYRQRMGIGAKEVVVGMASNGFTIADPNDAGQFDCVGFDTATPSVIAEFARS
jgi:60 kDa SS-A/Ro ribonucleoprotein